MGSELFSTLLQSPTLLAYSDPGIVSLALQSLCVVAFSATAGFLLGPWRWVASLFRRKDNEAEG